jgi:hypothetical protein
MDKDAKIKELEEEVLSLKTQLQSTEERLNKYLSHNKKYYENNKEVHKKRVKDYIQKTNYTPTPEKKKEYARTAYLNKKEKLKREQENLEENI